MIDLLKAKLAFENYVKNYKIENEKIRVKIEHIKRVSKISQKIATNLELEQEDIKLAELIGLLHDIGRFEQIKRYNTFKDKESINHGELGVHILFNQKDGLIREFINDKQYDEIIKKAILNHNKSLKEIEFDKLTARELLQIKIIRDSDKIDILNILTYEKKEIAWEKEDLTKDKISDNIYKEFMEKQDIDYNNRKTSADILVSHFAYVFDFNFKESITYINQKKYLEKIYNRFLFEDGQTMKRYINIYRKVQKYIKEKIGE